MKTVFLTGGGTGGHVYPNLALIPDLNKYGFRIVYVGGEGDTLERRAAQNAGVPYFGLPNIKFVRSINAKAMLNNLRIPSTLRKCVKRAKELIAAEKPDVVFSKGGYASLPLTLAALSKKVPVVCHESDLTAGLANKIAANKGAKLLTANPHSKCGEFVGMPLRRELFSGNAEKAKERLNIPKGKYVLLSVGGSGGAQTINNLLIRHLAELTKLFFVIHVYGKNGNFTPPNPLPANYLPLAYSDDMPSLYAAADVVLSRAGATAVFELAALGKRAVLIPLPKGASRGDQLYNAELAKEYGAQVLTEDKKLDSRFTDAILNAVNLPPMHKITNDSNGKIAEIINASIGRGDLCKNKKL